MTRSEMVEPRGTESVLRSDREQAEKIRSTALTWPGVGRKPRTFSRARSGRQR